MPWIVPSVVIGVPIGAFIIRRMRAETFRRICMSFDAWVVAFGLSKLIRELRLVDGALAYLVLAGGDRARRLAAVSFFLGCSGSGAASPALAVGTGLLGRRRPSEASRATAGFDLAAVKLIHIYTLMASARLPVRVLL